jgi:anti-anti-sigma factor
VDSSFQPRAVIVKQLPETLNPQQAHAFLRDLQGSLMSPRPRIVLDCSHLRQMNAAAIHLLLSCLEEAMKRNGDVRLAAIPRDTMAILKLNGMEHLFTIFPTSADAENSFQHLPHDLLSQTPPDRACRKSGNAT